MSWKAAIILLCLIQGTYLTVGQIATDERGSLNADSNPKIHARQTQASYAPDVRERGRCAATLLQANPQSVPSPWNGLAFPPPANMPICQEYQHTNVCCQPAQLTTLLSNMAQAGSLISRCPSCFNNFKRFWCAATCSPDQSLFYTPISVVNASDPLSWISSMAVTVNTPSIQGFYESCKDTKFPTTGSNVMTLFGGSKNAYDFINYLAYSSGQAPPLGAGMAMEVTFVNSTTENVQSPISNTTTVGMTFSTDPCTLSCSCTDCSLTCPPIPPPPPDTNAIVRIGTKRFAIITFVVFVLGVVGVLLVLAIGFALFFTRPRAFNKLESKTLSSSHVNRRKGKDTKWHLGILSILSSYFKMHGRYIARRPIAVIILAILFIGFTLCWVWRLKLLVKPEELWVPPGSLTATDKTKFDTSFGKFYRIEQVLLLQKDDLKHSPILTSSNLLKMLQAYNDLISMNVKYEHKNGSVELVNLEDICFRPLLGKGCLVNSPLNYFQEDEIKINNPFNPGGTFTIPGYIQYCSDLGKYSPFCMSAIGTPVDVQNVLGGYTGNDYAKATALIFTFLLNNEENDDANYRQLAWEEEFINYWKKSDLKNVFTIGFSAERSIQNELERSSNGDIPTIVISYLVMFIYVAFALGTLKKPFLINSRILLALGGILVVIFSVAISIGLCSLFGVAATLIITEVIPFLVLAIGVDNIFIMVDTFGALPRTMSIEDRMGEMLSRVGVSITMAAFSEAAAFLLGMLTRMPAVTAFAVYSCVAILFNWALQITFFAALISLDALRQEQGRYDVLPCIRNVKYAAEVELEEQEAENRQESDSHTTQHNNDKMENGKNITTSGDAEPIMANGLVATFMDRYYTRFLLHPITKIIVIALFLVLLLAAIGLIPSIELGLPQEHAMPKKSYLITYFEALAEFGRAGPPVYIVLDGPFNYTDRVMQNKLCSVDARTGGCRVDSIENSFYTESRLSTTGFLPNSTISSWINTYLIWLRPTTRCCNLYANGTFCPSTDSGVPADCDSCLTESDFDSYGRPSEATFMRFFDTWLGTICTSKCGSCGSVFASDIQLDHSKPPTSSEYINTTRFRAYHKNLASQADFINAIKRTYEFTDKLSDNLGLNAYPYSVFYIFFEQYLYVQNVAKLCIGVALGAILVVTLLLLSNVAASVIIVVIVGVIEVDLLGVMGLWNVNMNAVSVVNLVMAIGISVEFCVHIMHSFITHNGSREQRAKIALVEMGSSVLKGITLTKFVGVIVLAFAKSKIFQIYYFRMFFSIVILAGLHCLVFLPVLLSLVGPSTRKGPFAIY